MRRFYRGFAMALASFLVPMAARAGNGGYSVTYNHKFESGEREIMFMTDFTRPSRTNRSEGQNNYTSQMLEFEWNFTDRFASELMLEGYRDGNGTSEFTGSRLESRYRLFKEEVPFNPVLYVEYENLRTSTRFKMETSGWVKPPFIEPEAGDFKNERILESRLVLSQDFGQTNVAFNWINETDLRNGRTDFGYALGVMRLLDAGGHQGPGGGHHAEGPGFRLGGIGIEAYGGLGNDRKLDFSPSRQEHYLGPIVMFHLGSERMLHLSVVKGMSKSSDPLLIRFALGFDF